MALQIIGLYIIMVVGYSIFDVYLLFCEICKGPEGNPGILQGTYPDEKKPMTEKKGRKGRITGRRTKSMTVLLELKQKNKKTFTVSMMYCFFLYLKFFTGIFVV